jgi:hypothetical protein
VKQYRSQNGHLEPATLGKFLVLNFHNGVPLIESWNIVDVPQPTLDILRNICHIRHNASESLLETGYFVTHDHIRMNLEIIL